MHFKKIHLLFAIMMGIDALSSMMIEDIQEAPSITVERALEGTKIPGDIGAMVLDLAGNQIQPDKSYDYDQHVIIRGKLNVMNLMLKMSVLKSAKLNNFYNPSSSSVKLERIIDLIKKGFVIEPDDAEISSTTDIIPTQTYVKALIDAMEYCRLYGAEDDQILPVKAFLATEEDGIATEDLPYHNALIHYVYKSQPPFTVGHRLKRHEIAQRKKTDEAARDVGFIVLNEQGRIVDPNTPYDPKQHFLIKGRMVGEKSLAQLQILKDARMNASWQPTHPDLLPGAVITAAQSIDVPVSEEPIEMMTAHDVIESLKGAVPFVQVYGSDNDRKVGTFLTEHPAHNALLRHVYSNNTSVSCWCSNGANCNSVKNAIDRFREIVKAGPRVLKKLKDQMASYAAQPQSYAAQPQRDKNNPFHFLADNISVTVESLSAQVPQQARVTTGRR